MGTTNDLEREFLTNILSLTPEEASKMSTADLRHAYFKNPPSGESGGGSGSGSNSDITGTGMPNGVVSAPVGTYYTDLAGTNGAWQWLKTSGSGNTGWRVTYGDTGQRLLDSTQAGFNATQFSQWTEIRLSRINDIVFLQGYVETIAPLLGYIQVMRLARGFMPTTHVTAPAQGKDFPVGGLVSIQQASSYSVGFLSVGKASVTTPADATPGFYVAYQTAESWPTTLPGIPA